MPRWQRIYLAACAALIGGALGAILCQYAGWPRLTYHPYRRTFAFAPPSGSAVELGYVGIALWAAIGAAVLGAAAAVVGRLSRRELGVASQRLLAGWALTAAGLALVYPLWSLWPF